MMLIMAPRVSPVKSADDADGVGVSAGAGVGCDAFVGTGETAAVVDTACGCGTAGAKVGASEGTAPGTDGIFRTAPTRSLV